MLDALSPNGFLFNAIPDFSQTRVDVFQHGVLLQNYVLDQALADYDHILDNLHALNILLDATVQSGRLQRTASATFPLDPLAYSEFEDELATQQTKLTIDVLEELQATYFVLDNAEVYATEYLHGTWYQKPALCGVR